MDYRPLDLLEKLQILKENSPYMCKERVRACYFDLFFLASVMKCFIQEQEPHLFLNKMVDASKAKKNDGSEKSSESIFEDLISRIRLIAITIDSFNYQLINYLRKQPKNYITYIKEKVAVDFMTMMESVVQVEDVEIKIYDSPQSDLMHDIYLVVNAAYSLTLNLEKILSGEVDATEVALNYEISDMYDPKKDSEVVEEKYCPKGFGSLIWNGTPSELAYLMATLQEKGYIDAPMRDRFNRNNESYHKIICSFLTLANGTPRTVLNALKDNTISSNNGFKVALDKLPRKM